MTMIMGKAGRQPSRFSAVFLLVSVLAAVVSLGSVVSTQAMPVEARTTTPWYSYQSRTGFDYTVQVEKGRFYTDSVMKPDQLMKIRGPVEPPVYRRVILSKFADSLTLQIPYSFKADRPAALKTKWRVDGTLMIPGMWQQPYPLLAETESTTTGSEISGVETFVIPLAKFLADMDDNRLQYGINAEPVELHVTPTLEIEAGGLKEPVSVTDTGEFVVTLKQTTIEVDDPKDIRVEKNLADTQIVPITVSLLGSSVKVALVRQVSIGALVVFLLLTAALAWSRRKKPDNQSVLQRLGPNLISARAFELPGDTAVVDVHSARELMQLQVQTERPVIRVGSTYYLQDGTTCYRLTLTGGEESSD